MKFNTFQISVVFVLTALSFSFSVTAAPAEYKLLDTYFIDDGGDPGSESSPRLLVFDANANLLYASSHRFVSGVLDGRLLAIEPGSGTLIDGVSYNYGQNYGLVVAKDGKRVYVSRSARNNGGGPSVRVFDTDPASASFWSEIGPINTGGSSYGLDASAITPDGSRIYVTHRGSFVVHAINTSDNSFSSIPVPAGNSNGSQLSGIATTPDGRRAYAVNRTNQTVVAIDTDPSSGTFNTVVGTIRTSNGASNGQADIIVGPDGLFAYTVQNTKTEISVIDIDPGSPTFESEIAKIPITGFNHIQMSVSPDNLTLFVTSTSTHELQIVDIDPNSPTFRTEVGVISFPAGSNPWDVKVVTEGPEAGSIFVTLPGSGSIALIGVENPNTPPTADASDDQSIRAGDTVNLDGRDSYDDNTSQPDLIYAWSFSSIPVGSAATLIGADTATPSFVADIAGSYFVSLVVTDEGGLTSDPDEVIVGSENLAPTAIATSNYDIYIVGDTANLDGSQSSDPENDVLTYLWVVDSSPTGSSSSVSDAAILAPSLLLDVEGAYNISLTVSDFIGPGSIDTVSIVATTAIEYAEIQIIEASDIILDLESDQTTTPGHQKSMGNDLKNAIKAILKGKMGSAIDKLNSALIRTDGCVLRGSPDQNGSSAYEWDYVTDCGVQEELYGLISRAIDALNP